MGCNRLAWGIALALIATRASAWELAKERDGVKVYTRSVEGSGMKEAKAVTTVPATLDAAVALVNDIPSFIEWFDRCKETRVVKEAGPLEHWNYFVSKAPFPVSDRDMIIHAKIHQEPDGTLLIKMESAPDVLPPQKGRVRVTKLRGAWSLRPVGNSVEVTYQIWSEPGGSVPDSMAASQAIDGPLNTVVNLRKMVQKEKYRSAKVEWLKH